MFCSSFYIQKSLKVVCTSFFYEILVLTFNNFLNFSAIPLSCFLDYFLSLTSSVISTSLLLNDFIFQVGICLMFFFLWRLSRYLACVVHIIYSILFRRLSLVFRVLWIFIAVLPTLLFYSGSTRSLLGYWINLRWS